MSLQILSENVESSKLSFINESSEHAGKKYLGRLRGICAECGKPTRNKRVYSKTLWEKVLSSDTFKEQLSCKCLFGELNHPADRLETDIKEVAVALSDVAINEDTVTGTFDILDTPNGRILKSLCDYGAVLGVSSRGGGDTFNESGYDRVDEDSYDFVAFDVVALPAVVKARPKVIESVEHKQKASNLQESIKMEIAHVETLAELNSIKRIVENVNIPECDSILELIDTKLEGLSGGNTSDALLEDLNSALAQVKQLETEKMQLTEKLSAGATREFNLKSECIKLRNASRILGEKLNRVPAAGTIKKEVNVENVSKLETRIAELESVNSRLDAANKKLNESLAGYRKAASHSIIESDYRKVKDSESQWKRKCESLNSSIEVLKEESVKDVKALTEKYDTYRKDAELKLSLSNKKLAESLKRVETLTASSNKLLDAYLTTVCKTRGINVADVRRKLPESFTIADVDTVITQVSDYKVRIGSLPFAITENVRATVSEPSVQNVSKSDNPDDECLDGALSLLAITNPSKFK